MDNQSCSYGQEKCCFFDQSQSGSLCWDLHECHTCGLNAFILINLTQTFRLKINACHIFMNYDTI